MSRRFGSRSWVLALCASAFLCSARGEAAPGELDVQATAGLSASNASDSPLEAERVRAFLDRRYTRADVRHSFHTKFGEQIDCIDFFAQEGVKQLAANGQPITELPKPMVQRNVPAELRDILFTGTRDDDGKARACPPGSVPILRITPEHIRAAGGLDAFVSAHQRHFAGDDRKVGLPPSGGSGYGHVQQGYTGTMPVIAGIATVSVHKPLVVLPGDHSVMQTWLTDTRSSRNQSVETGTNVDYGLYGDRNTHFFIYATRDDHATTGCYNNVGSTTGKTCLTWIAAPGATLTPGMTLSSSTFNGTQAELTLLTQAGNVGYSTSGWNIVGAGVYPRTDFIQYMQDTATSFTVGGEIYDSTQSWYVPMGSGAEPQAGYGQAAYWVSSESHGLGVIKSGTSTWDYGSFSGIGSEHPSDYGANWSGGRVFVGPLQHSFYSSDYGFQWSAIGDWASGSYKAQCDYTHGVPLRGVATRTDGSATESILCGGFIQTGYANSCNARNFSSGDNRGSYDNGWDWDPGYVKGECGYMEVATGIAQSQSHQLNTILCCSQRNNPDHSSCTVEQFDTSDSPSYGSGPDWAGGLYKGICPLGKAVVGISRKKTGGAAHALLCCFMQ